MRVTRRTLGAVVLACGALGAGLSPASAVHAADRLERVEDAYAVRQLRRTAFDPREARNLEPSESRFLEDLFSITDEAVLLNTDTIRWFSTGRGTGLHAVDYFERMDALRARLSALEMPKPGVSVRDRVAEALRLQREFVAEWHEAREDGRPFESQITNEFAFHAGLHRSHRMLLQAFTELHALFPDVGETTHRAFHDHLRALDLR